MINKKIIDKKEKRVNVTLKVKEFFTDNNKSSNINYINFINKKSNVNEVIR